VAVELGTEDAGVDIDLAIVLQQEFLSSVGWKEGDSIYKRTKGDFEAETMPQCDSEAFSRHPLDKAYNEAKKNNGI